MVPETHGTNQDGDLYFELVRSFPLRPLRSEDELDRAMKIMDELLSRGDLDSDRQDYLDVLSDLVERYEDKVHSIPAATDAQVLQHLIEARGVRQVELAQATSIAESTISAVLSGARKLTREQIERLAAHFGISPAAFMESPS